MGLTSSGDEFCARTDKALAGIPGVFKLVDDILMVADNVKQLLGRIKSVFKRCQDHGITLSNTKFQVGSKVKFAGYVVSDKGKEPDLDKGIGERELRYKANNTHTGPVGNFR